MLTRLRPTVFLGLLALALAFQGNGAAAGVTWCRADPVVRIGQQEADVFIDSPAAMLDAATDKIRLVVTVPMGVEAQLRRIEADFGEGYDVRFVESSKLRATADRIQVRVQVYAPATDGTLPVLVTLSPRGSGPLVTASAVGTANAWVSLTSS